MPAQKEKAPAEEMPVFLDTGKDYTDEWGKLLQGGENIFPTEASYANHYFNWPHIINGERREQFDCTKVDSFKLIPPQTYLVAYREAKRNGEI